MATATKTKETGTAKDRTALIADLERLREPDDQLALLLNTEAAAQTAFDEATAVLEPVRQELQAAGIAVGRERTRRGAERDALEAELRATASPKIEEFKQWAVRRHADMTTGMPDPNRDRELLDRQRDAARDAIQGIGDLTLLDEDAMAERLAELRDEIGLAE